jgi:ubiquitin-associated SH3 domain-containing protein
VGQPATAPEFRRLIVYACPTGDFAAQLDAYFAQSRALFGENTAHQYPPHISLTGFYHDVASTIPAYVQQLDHALATVRQLQPAPVISLTRLNMSEDFHGIEIESMWLKQVIDVFITFAQSSTRRDAIRKKDWLHLSLAYHFEPAQGTKLKELAQSHIRLNAPVRWQLRFYEQHPDKLWTCHKTWNI